MKFEQIAELCYEVNRAICEAEGDPLERGSWATADSELKSSVRKGVVNQLSTPVNSSEESHSRWVESKNVEGWVYGEELDREKKTHPNMVPYSELPFSQRVKDHVFLAIVNVCKSQLPKNSALE